MKEAAEQSVSNSIFGQLVLSEDEANLKIYNSNKEQLESMIAALPSVVLSQ